MKLICIFNMAPLYREPIYKAMDKKWDINWCFGPKYDNIKDLDYNALKTVHKLNRINLPLGFSWMKGAIKQAFSQRDAKIILTGDILCLSNWAILLINLLSFSKSRCYLWTHGWYGREGKCKQLIKRLFFALSKSVFLYSNYAKDVAIQNHVNPNKLAVIHNSLDYTLQKSIVDTLSPSDIYTSHFKNTNPVVIFIGRQTKQKKLFQLIHAIANLNKQNIHINLVIVGDGNEAISNKSLSNNLGVNTWFFGECYNERTNAELIYNADLCVAPGNVGLTALHAMTFGTPVISHNDFSSQMPEVETIVDGKTGTFFEKNSITDLQLAISNWLKQHTNRHQIREECMAEVSKSWSPLYQINIIESLLLKTND